MGANTTKLHKFLSPKECRIEEQHVKSIVDEVKISGKVDTFWIEAQPLLYMDVTAWKSCYVLHNIFFNGPKQLQIPISCESYLKDMINNNDKIYGWLVGTYADFLLLKIKIIQEYPYIPQNIDIEFTALEKEQITENLFKDLLNILDKSIELQMNKTISTNKLNSMSERGQCIMSPFMLSLKESTRIRNLCVNIYFESELAADLAKYESELLELVDEIDKYYFKPKFNYILLQMPKELREPLVKVPS